MSTKTNEVVYANLGSNIGARMMYIRSTDIEQKNWVSLLASFPDEALYFMTRGKKIIIVDKSSNKGKVEHVFCPAFSDFLRNIRGEPMLNFTLLPHIRTAVSAYEYNKFLHTKYSFFKNKLKTLEVIGRTIRVAKEKSVWENK